MARLSRRDVLKGSATAAGVAVAAPAILKAHDALASSGTVNVFAWGDYDPAFVKGQNIIPDFEAKTGIKVNYATYGSNDELANKVRAAGGKGFDVIFPSITNSPQYEDASAPNGMYLLPIDESKANVGAVVPSIYRDSIKLGGVRKGKRVLIPFDWGTEGLTFDSSVHNVSDDEVSYGLMWLDGKTKQTALRQKSAIVGVALLLDAEGKFNSSRGADLYGPEDKARAAFEAAAKFIIDHKANIGAFWNNGTEATAAFNDAGCTVGQTWDNTGIMLGRDNKKWKYRTPKEGALTWLDSVGISAGAANVDQAYAFINHLLTPEAGGKFAIGTGYNSVVKGSEGFAGDQYKAEFTAIYTPKAVEKLWWWQADTPWFPKLQAEYSEKIKNA